MMPALHSLGLALLISALVVACSGPDVAPPRAARFGTLFHREGQVVLEEPDTAPITGIRSLSAGPNGEIVVVDKGRAQVRIHSSDGRLLDLVGRFGGGPGEFREPVDARFDELGRLYVADANGSKITRLHPDRSFDTAYHAPGLGIYEIDWARRGLFVTLWNDLLGQTPYFQAVVDTATGQIVSLLAPIDSTLWEVPYWRSFHRPIGGAGSTVMVTGGYLLYPFRLYGADGRLARTFGSPPPSYRAPRRPEAGQFTGPGGFDRLETWLRGLTWVSRLDVYRDSLIFAVHADADPRSGALDARIDRTMDIYDTRGNKLWVDVPLPGLRVLRTEDFLYVLEARPPDGPWTVVRYAFIGEPPS